MQTFHLVDPSFRDLITKFPTYDADRDTLADYRRRVVEAYSAAQPPQHEERIIPGPADAPNVRVLLYRPKADSKKLPAVLSIHGGGFNSGTADMVGAGCRAMADKFGVLVVNVDYRLAPESPFPAPLEDCYATLKWMSDQAGQLGIDSTRIILMGGSAGGGLAAALALLARDRKDYVLRAQVLNYPMLDARTGTPEAPVDNVMTGEFIWTRRSNQQGWRHMRGDGVIPPEKLGYFSPALAEDLSGLPPTFIAVGSLDLLLEEDVAYALRLARAGVPVETHVYPGAVHGFKAAPGSISKQAERDLQAAMDRFVLDDAKSNTTGT